ncbi:helix-turn-helix transcriptional regulator [Paenibacillus arenilitoris]|uniref:AraC family transcriptional regulator n=1 Tax=Paenibacillus arenilitoris TaxID=2772299 RepID=A0A927CL69_9BACL|nr:helix-turn-helix domain-containing protein [Paenibacillus arenilitoris]MBD2867670.1 AraC family transcriptional regulator [Paenibacillus arenilitoris]
MSTQHKINSPYTITSASDFNFKVPYHTHSHYEIYYFHSGKANYLINDRIYVLEPGDLLLMHGMTLHRAHIDPNVAYHRTTLHFDPYYFQQFIQSSFAGDLLAPFRQLQNVRLRLRGEDQAEAEASLEKLVRLYDRKDSFSQQRFQAHLLDLLILINQLCEQPLKAKISFPTSKERHVQSVISYLEGHYQEDITLESLQEELHLSKYYLAKTFKEVTGSTIFQFLMQRRIYQAKIALIGEDKPITDIGYEVGFKHPSHFSRAFKLQTALTPEQYRKQNRLRSPIPL